MKSKLTIAIACALALVTLGCEGRIDVQAQGGGPAGDGVLDPSVDSDGDGIPDDGEPPPGTIVRPPDEQVDEDVCQFIDPGTTPLRRLTADEYHNSVRDLFGVEVPTQTLTPDERVSGFEANVVAPVTELMAEEYQRAAENISEALIAEDGVWPDSSEEAVLRAHIESIATRAFRRPAETEEVEALYSLYTAGAEEFDATTGAQMVIEAVLQSPNFLYRVEVGEAAEDEVVQLTDYEMASRLSYFLWGSIPDDALLQAAAAGELSSRDQIESHARRMLEDERARERINDVFAQWLRVDAIETVDHGDEAFTEEMRRSMMAETQAFIDEVVWEGDARVSTLLTANYTFADANTASLYGVEVDADGGLVRIDLPEDRAGILTHPGVLSAYGHGQTPVYRGKFIREALLCTPPYQAPDNIEALPTFEGESMRSKAEKRMNATQQGCAGCHLQYDGIGLVFDNYDALGRYRVEDEFGNALTDEGQLHAAGDIEGPVDGVADLATRLAESEMVQACVAKQFFRYTTARNEGQSDACSMHLIQEALTTSGGDIREMLIALTTTDAFRYRKNMSADM